MTLCPEASKINSRFKSYLKPLSLSFRSNFDLFWLAAVSFPLVVDDRAPPRRRPGWYSTVAIMVAKERGRGVDHDTALHRGGEAAAMTL